MAIADFIKRDMLLIEADLGFPVVTWNGEDYRCINASAGELAALETGGFNVSIDLVLKIRKELFTDNIYPESQQKATFQSTEYRIARVKHDATGAFIVMFLISPNRGV